MAKTINKILEDIDKKLYNELMTDYYTYSMSLSWTMKNGEDIIISDMKDSHIKNCINMIKNKPDNGYRIAWIEIFNDVLLKRRKLKINKIKNNYK